MSIITWLNARRRRASETKFNNGYAYAAGVLLANWGALQAFQKLVGEVSVFDYTEFDAGMQSALYRAAKETQWT